MLNCFRRQTAINKITNNCFGGRKIFMVNIQRNRQKIQTFTIYNTNNYLQYTLDLITQRRFFIVNKNILTNTVI